MFVIDALPAIVLGVITYVVLPDRPDAAAWLTAEERSWLVHQLAHEQAARESVRRYGVWEVMRNGRVLAFALAYFGMNGLGGALTAFLPQILKGFGLTNTQSSFVAMIPYFIGFIGMVGLGFWADRPGQRKWAALGSLGVAAVGFWGAALTDDPALKLAMLSLASIGAFGCMPVFWGLPTTFLSGAAAAAALALINAIGSLSNFFNTWAVGLIRDATGSFNGGLMELGAMTMMSMLVVALVHYEPRPRASASAVQLGKTVA